MEKDIFKKSDRRTQPRFRQGTVGILLFHDVLAVEGGAGLVKLGYGGLARSGPGSALGNASKRVPMDYVLGYFTNCLVYLYYSFLKLFILLYVNMSISFPLVLAPFYLCFLNSLLYFLFAF